MTKNEMLFKLGEVKAETTFKYDVEITSSNYSNIEECENIKDVEYLLAAVGEKYYTKITVYDRELKDFIYYKDILTEIPEIDTLVSRERDLRTTTRRIK